MNNSELYKLWDEFLDLWPVQRVEAMTLEEYTKAGDPDSFMNWVEFRTKPLATISGSSSFIFGIYSRKDQTAKSNTKNNIYEDEYAWRVAYGNTKERAFLYVKTQILAVINAIQNHEIHKIEEIDLIKTVKWKIAFLYQDRKNLKIIPTFAEQRLRYLTGVDVKDKGFTIENAYKQLMSEKGDQDLFEFNDFLTQKYLEANPKDKFNTQIAYDYMHERYPSFEKTAEYLFIVENQVGIELALETTDFNKPAPRVFIKFEPPKSIQGLKIEFKPKNKRSNSNLDSTKTLKNDSEFFQITISNMSQLESLCDWWETYDGSEILRNGNDKKINGDNVKNSPTTLNRILFGAAGTGKTYNTINHALSIIENKSLEELGTENREELKKRFDSYKEKGQIKFVTFHQSFSYEDFVEGIRAESDEDGNLNYLVKDGIFKEISIDAQIEIDSKKIAGNVPTEFSINSAIERLIERAKQTEQVFYTKRKAEIKVTSNSSGTLFALNSKETTITLSIRHIKNYLKTQQDNIVDNKAYEWAIAKSLRSEVEYEKANSGSKPYVLIIDEINRGNISRIFGELITLIEDSKRAGAEEELSVILPYSKQEFTVPHNVYIIGTMNSSDRSLTGLDIALRRRFTFIEMPPQPQLLDGVNVDGIDIKRLLTVINQRIEALLDRDHCIGHANFMHLKEQPTLNNLSVIFKQKIIPQLQEYFFDDWAKINLVLNGNGMLHSKPIEKTAIFPNVDSEELGYFEDKKAWELVPTSFDSIESFTKIIQH